MHKVTQQLIGYPWGQCTEAGIASVFDVELDDVPILADRTQPVDADIELLRPDSRFCELCKWINARGRFWMHVMLERKQNTFEEMHSLMWNNELVFNPKFTLRINSDFEHLILGSTITGLGHVIVGRNGKPIWDPNPSAVHAPFVTDGIPHTLLYFDSYVLFPPLEILPSYLVHPEVTRYYAVYKQT